MTNLNSFLLTFLAPRVYRLAEASDVFVRQGLTKERKMDGDSSGDPSMSMTGPTHNVSSIPALNGRVIA